jgi:hypothetical protein
VRVPRRLLGRHVRQSADELADLRVQRGRLNIGIGCAGDAEVQNFGLTVGGDQDVPGLQITVNDALGVSVMNGLADADEKLETLACRELGGADVFVEWLALHQLHREVRLRPGAGVGNTRFVHARDPRVLQPRQQVRLVIEAPLHRLAHHPRTDDLQRHAAVRVVLLGLVHRSHPAAPEDPHDAERPDLVQRRLIAQERHQPGAVLRPKPGLLLPDARLPSHGGCPSC